MKYYILFGPPGAGKGTQAEHMAPEYNLLHISTGELLRSEIAAGTPLGKIAEELIDKGNFVPDQVVEDMLFSTFDATKGVEGFLLDGFPRTIAQAEALEKRLGASGESVTAVLSLHIPDAVIYDEQPVDLTQSCRQRIRWAKGYLQVFRNDTPFGKHFSDSCVVIDVFLGNAFLSLKILGLNVDAGHFCGEVFGLNGDGGQEISQGTALRCSQPFLHHTGAQSEERLIPFGSDDSKSLFIHTSFIKNTR